MIRDQRTMIGLRPLANAEEVVEAWRAYVPHLVEMDTEIFAYVSAGRWVADCATPGCNGGIACWPEHNRGACLDCGHVYAIVFPGMDERLEGEALLSYRGEDNQNWRPDKGEKTQMLRAENIAMGLEGVT